MDIWTEREARIWTIAAELELDSELEMVLDFYGGGDRLRELFDNGEPTDYEIRDLIYDMVR